MIDLVQGFRFPLDRLETACGADLLDPSETLNHGLRRHFLANSLRITSSLTPRLSSVLEEVSTALHFESPIEAFVFAGSDPQAFCAPSETESLFTLMMSSGLVQLLSNDELQFVVGHEIGHFIFEHYRYPQIDSFEEGLPRLLLMQLRRASEISADRIGAISTSKIEAAFSALLKIASGLPSGEFSVNMSDVLQQVRDLEQLGPHYQTLYETHPSVPVRVKALFRLANSEGYHSFRGLSQEPLFSDDQLNEDVALELTGRHQDIFNEQANDVIRTFVLWSALLIFVSDRQITTNEREALGLIAGTERASAALTDMSSLGRRTLEDRVIAAARRLADLPADYAGRALDEVMGLAAISSSPATEEIKFVQSAIRRSESALPDRAT